MSTGPVEHGHDRASTGHSPDDEIALEVADLDPLISDAGAEPDRWKIIPPVLVTAGTLVVSQPTWSMEASV
jgi:hypothetical protein